MKYTHSKSWAVLGTALVCVAILVACAQEPAGLKDVESAEQLVTVGFTSRDHDPTDEEVRAMVDEVIAQVLGPEGLAAIISPGDRVVLKPNNVYSERDDVRGVITDPRITRYVAEKAREIVGFDGAADVKVVDTVFMLTSNPSPPVVGFGRTRFDRNANGVMDDEDFFLDRDADGIVDGPSQAELVNLDSIGEWGRFKQTVVMPTLGTVDIYLPKMLRTREQAIAAGEPDEYTDVLISLPVLKSHWAGLTCAIKSHYGIRYGFPFGTEVTRMSHSGTRPLRGENMRWQNSENPFCLDEYLTAMHVVRTYDFVITDCLVGQSRAWNKEGRIFMHSMLASRDAVANDTAAALFAGIRPASIEYLPIARRCGVGTDETGWIRVAGLDALGSHRRRVYERWQPEDRYPWPEGYGGIKTIGDFDAPDEVTVSEPMTADDGRHVFAYQAKEGRPTDLGLARVELLVDGELYAFANTDLDYPGLMEVDLGGLEPGPHSYRIAAWDRALNCALSEERTVEIETTPTAGAARPSLAMNVSNRVLPKMGNAETEMAKLEGISQPPRLIRDLAYSEPRPKEESPRDIAVPLETSAVFVALACSYEPAQYQWTRDGVALPGATAASYIIARTGQEDAGQYTCLVSNSVGSVETEATTLAVTGEPVALASGEVPEVPGVETGSFAGIEFVRVPPGTFEMGSPEEEIRRQPREGPRHAVTISKGYWMGRFEVTKAQWLEVMGTEPWKGKLFAGDEPDSPASYISWQDAQAFVGRLNQRGEGTFRLPTEAEWEYACRSGSAEQYHYGADSESERLGDFAWFSTNAYRAGQRYSHPVGTKRPNAWGLYDMMGNVWEWCADWYEADYYAASPESDPTGPATGSRKVLRGGAWCEDASGCRSARRHRDYPAYRILGVGFRVCREE
jgi:formylglycine-generating enzyme required for sulfatase activity/uncharacterized protein (DUF362 family)